MEYVCRTSRFAVEKINVCEKGLIMTKSVNISRCICFPSQNFRIDPFGSENLFLERSLMKITLLLNKW